MKTKLKDARGFTIIEVLIVLAIAGLIMLIVFLAVPALQRNSRNTQRTNDASRIAAAVNECLNNNNGKVSECNSLTTGKTPDYITIADNQQLTAATSGINGATLTFSVKCNDTGTSTSTAGGTRSFALLYQVEGTGSKTATRCIGS